MRGDFVLGLVVTFLCSLIIAIIALGVVSEMNRPDTPPWEAFWVYQYDGATYKRYTKEQCDEARRIVGRGSCIPMPMVDATAK